MGIPVASTKDALSEVNGRAIRRNVEEFRGEVSVHGRGCGKEFEADGTGDFNVVIEGRSRVDQDVIPFFNRALVARTRSKMIAIAA